MSGKPYAGQGTAHLPSRISFFAPVLWDADGRLRDPKYPTPGPYERLPQGRGNRTFHRYTYDGPLICMRESYRLGDGDTVCFVQPEVTRQVQVVPGGGGSVVYADNDRTQDTALVDRFGRPLFMFRNQDGYHRNVSAAHWDKLRHGGVLKPVSLPTGPYADFAPWYMGALEPDFLAGRRGVLGWARSRYYDPGLLVPGRGADMSWWDNVRARWAEDPWTTVGYAVGGGLLIVGGALVIGMSGGFAAPLGMWAIGMGLGMAGVAFAATGTASHNFEQAVGAGTIAGVSTAAAVLTGGWAYGSFAPLGPVIGSGMSWGIAGFTGTAVSGIMEGRPIGEVMSDAKLAFAGSFLAGTVLAGIGVGVRAARQAIRGPTRGDLYVHLTSQQYSAVQQAGRLGRGYRGWMLDEGRIWATRYRADQFRGFRGMLRKLSIGQRPSWRPQHTIRITGEAAAAFSRAMGPRFSLNPWGWTKGLTSQYQLRGTLRYSGGNIVSSTVGATAYSGTQMALYRTGELTRALVYSAVPGAILALILNPEWLVDLHLAVEHHR